MKYRDRGVVGIGLGGPEEGHPPEPYADAFALARSGGLGLGAARGRGGRRGVGARRARRARRPTGSGTGSARSRIPASSPSSPAAAPSSTSARSRTSARASSHSLEDHPLPQLVAAGVRCSISTDDPAMFDTDLTRDYEAAASLGVSPRAAYEAGLAGALCDDETRDRLRQIGDSHRAGTIVRVPPMAIAREAGPVGSLHEVREAGLDREDLLGVYRNMLVTRGVEERGHILYRQGKIPGSFYTGRGNEAAAVGVATAMGPEDVGTPLHRDMGVHIVARRRAVADLRPVHGPPGRADARPRRQRPHGRLAARADRDGQPPAGDAPGRHRLRARLPDPRRVARRSRLVRRGSLGARRRARVDDLRRHAQAADRLRLRQQPVGVLDAVLPRVRDRARRRPRRGVRLRGSRRRRHRRARRLPRGEARDRQGARRRRADAARVPHAADGGPCRARRRVLRPEADVRTVGRVGPDRALPHLAARQRRVDRRGGGRDRGRRQAAAHRRARARRGVAAARPVHPHATASSPRPRTSTPRTTSRWPS